MVTGLNSTVYGIATRRLVQSMWVTSMPKRPTPHSASTVLSAAVPNTSRTPRGRASTMSPALSRTTLIARPFRLLLFDIIPVIRNILLQVLNLLLQLLYFSFYLRLVAVRRAFACRDSLTVDDEETAALEW